MRHHDPDETLMTMIAAFDVDYPHEVLEDIRRESARLGIDLGEATRRLLALWMLRKAAEVACVSKPEKLHLRRGQLQRGVYDLAGYWDVARMLRILTR